MENKTIAILLLAGMGFYLMNKQNSNQYTHVPPPPSHNPKDEQWQRWLKTILTIFGFAESLFGKDGPLHGIFKNKKELTDFLDENNIDYSDIA